ncbi:hypothetical protein G6F46_002260 [Rhizopus delemar]|nr:hypothetical protein G6F54_002068 [Rhizopus delemar]KAG1516291.1 hypothetical protein G6F53_002274 [Rhizopus delemar]KAG1594721.1 hypothetical protein G6F48_001160 [Rhizopus delemar]KAG1602252.1 hypothetical protein G6F47_002942 [Rhizopus delemar]KAG1620629.1 hypothetical protein G6F46_002260 [Rhizopus delemar]
MNISDTSPVDLKPNSRSSSVMSVDDDLFTETKRRRLVSSATNSVESSPCPSSTSSVIDLTSLSDQDTPTQSMHELTLSDKKPSRQALFLEQMRRRQEMKEKQKLEQSQKQEEQEKAKEEMRRQLLLQHQEFQEIQKQQKLKESLLMMQQFNERKEQERLMAEQVAIEKEKQDKIKEEERAARMAEKRMRILKEEGERREIKRKEEEEQRKEMLKIEEEKKRRKEREEKLKREIEEEKRRMEERRREEEERKRREEERRREEEKQREIELKYQSLQQKLKQQEREQRIKEEREREERMRKEEKEQQQQQQQTTEKDQDVMIDEEMTNRNLCIGMIKTEIVTLGPLNLIKDDRFELVHIIPEGRRHNNNYSFAVTSRTIPPKSLGWIPFSDTRVLGPLVDYQMIWWDAVIPRNKVTQTRTPLFIIMYCRPQTMRSIAKYLQDQRLYLAEPPFFNPECRYSNPHANIIEPVQQQYMRNTNYSYGYSHNYQKQTQRDIEQLLESIPNNVPNLKRKKKRRKMRPVIQIESQDEDENLIIEQEMSEEISEDDDEGYVEGLTIRLMNHQISGVSWMMDRENNEKSQGGILADDMGLGKTIQTIALIASTMKSTEKRRTLIVTPLALIQQWADEIKSKTEKGAFKVLIHHGPNRTRDPNKLKNYDVVITTYQVVAGDMPSDQEKKDQEVVVNEEFGPLFQITWYRVVLDEAQQIKNRTTRSSVSCSALLSTKRWCLTGTPIQNNVDELYSLLRFLKIQPLNDYTMFRRTISIPIQNGNAGLALSRLKAVLMAIMLRRTKAVLMKKEEEESSFDLPKREKNDILLQFSEYERRLYDLLKTKTQNSVEQLLSQGQAAYLNMLCLLLRLRQACDHPKLILSSLEEKDVCDILSDTSVTTINNKKIICELCGSSMESSFNTFCENCQTQIESTVKGGLFKTSTKINKMLEILQETREKYPNEKTIIFSQFTSMLDLLDIPLSQHGFTYCRYDGSMSAQERERSLLSLRYDQNCTVMLISLKCGSLGLNLTAANRVILMDIWWNPALEEQAIDRVHRIGQRLPVYVTRLMIDNTVEEKIIKLQEKKAMLSKGALGDGSMVKNTKLSVNEIRSLFEM